MNEGLVTGTTDERCVCARKDDGTIIETSIACDIHAAPDTVAREDLDELDRWVFDEPPEPDGECYRGTEAASALAEEQARIQRELKR